MPPTLSRELEYPMIFFNGPLLEQHRTSPCQNNCPSGNAIQRALRLIEQGDYDEALETFRATNPFPGIMGRICPHPCETSCNRNHFDDPISIRALERAAAAHGRLAKRPKPKESTGKRVAVIGAGPAGLTCAYYLTLLGHETRVFEALPVLGGIPRFGIPDRQLPKDIVDREVALILEVGVEVRMNTKIGTDLSFDELAKGYNACLIAIGSVESTGQDLSGSVFDLGRIYPKDIDSIKEMEGLDFSEDKTLKINPVTLATGREGIFAAGHIVSPDESVAAAIGSGRLAAVSIDAYLRGDALEDIRRIYINSAREIILEKYYKGSRKKNSQCLVEFDGLANLSFFQRKRRIKPASTNQVYTESPGGSVMGYIREEASEEAKRCFHCGHCFSCGTCVDICPGDILRMVDHKPQLVYPEECIHCGACLLDCPAGAISFHLPLPLTISSYPGKSFDLS